MLENGEVGRASPWPAAYSALPHLGTLVKPQSSTYSPCKFPPLTTSQATSSLACPDGMSPRQRPAEFQDSNLKKKPQALRHRSGVGMGVASGGCGPADHWLLAPREGHSHQTRSPLNPRTWAGPLLPWSKGSSVNHRT
jgi:hypothetical protein